MNAKHVLKRAALTLAGASLLAPPANLLAAGPQTVAPVAAAKSASILDVALAQSGVLSGQVVNTQGAPQADTKVSVQAGGKEIAAAVTAQQGQFAVNNLRGGNYTIAAGDSMGAYRLWTAGAAPPAAKPGVLLVSGRQIARGQSAGFPTRTGLIVLGTAAAIVTAGVITQENDSSS